jgi:hypothetical protein
MKQLKVMLVMAILSTLFCVGCSEKDEGNSNETQQGHSENDGHDHSSQDDHSH